LPGGGGLKLLSKSSDRFADARIRIGHGQIEWAIWSHANVDRRPAQRRRRRFPEQRPICDGKAAELPETVIGRNLGHVRIRRPGPHQRESCKVHATQPQIADWTHPELLLAASAQRAFRHPCRSADFVEVDGTQAIRQRKSSSFEMTAAWLRARES